MTEKIYTQEALDKAIVDVMARCVRIAEMHTVAVFDARSVGYMEAVNRIVSALKEEAAGKFQLVDGTEVEGSILERR
jgi:hypothetical protein